MSLPLQSFRHAAQLITLLGLVHLLAGCPGDTRPPSARPGPAAQAQSAAASGDYTAAAAQYQQLAIGARGSQASEFLMQAAHLYARAGDPAQARTLAARIDPPSLSTTQAQAYSVLQAHLELADGQPRAALDRLSRVSSLPPWSVEWLWEVQADAANVAGEPLRSLRSRVVLDARLPAGQRKQENEHALWRTLQGLPASELSELVRPGSEPVLAGWAQLAQTYRNSPPQPDALRHAVVGWEQRHPKHPAGDTFVAWLLDQSRQMSLAPGHVAVLLPTAGALAGPAGAVREGIAAAWYQTPADSRPVLRFHAVPDNAALVVDVYQNAVAQGADLIIGPLRREAVEALTAANTIQVTTLALNRIAATADLPPQLYQFGLPPEDEAVAAVEQAAAQGYTQALILAPVGERGDRVSNAFATAVIDNGGVLLEEQRYDNSQISPFNKPIEALLDIDIARARHRALERKTGKEMRFDVKRREDAEYIFVYAYPIDSRQIVPQLAFYDAGNLPTFTTSHAYDGRPDRDLQGIHFATTPWQADPGGELALSRHLLREARPARFGAYDRLYALGIDAYRLTTELPRLRSFTGQTLSGATGELSIDNAGRIHRRPLWARVDRGTVQLSSGIDMDPAAPPGGQAPGQPTDQTAPDAPQPPPGQPGASADPAGGVVATPTALPPRIESRSVQ